MNKPFLVLSLAASLAGCVAAPKLRVGATASQHAFFPDAYTYSVGDFVLSLPVGYYEFAMQRLQFAKAILRDGAPKPVEAQQNYLVLPESTLAPRREFLVLDQHHLLISSGILQLPDAGPARLEVLHRDDATWTDLSDSVLPSWTRRPSTVSIEPSTGVIDVSASNPTRHATLRWQGTRFSITESPQ